MFNYVYGEGPWTQEFVIRSYTIQQCPELQSILDYNGYITNGDYLEIVKPEILKMTEDGISVDVEATRRVNDAKYGERSGIWMKAKWYSDIEFKASLAASDAYNKAYKETLEKLLKEYNAEIS